MKERIKLFVSIYNLAYYISIVSIVEYLVLGFHYALREKFDGDFNNIYFMYFLAAISFVISNKIFWKTKMENIK